MNWTLTDIERKMKAGTIAGYRVVSEAKETAKKSKYGNRKMQVDNIAFDSEKEGRRYQDLKLLLQAGEISDLKMQVKYELNQGGTYRYCYIADFTYLSGGVLFVEDVKPFSKGEYYLTPTFKKKMKLMKKIHGINIKIT